MSDKDGGFLEVLAVSLQVLDKCVDNMALASDFADVCELAGFVTAYNRLDLECLAECCGYSGNPSASLEMLEIVYNKPVRNVLLGALDVILKLLDRRAFLIFFACHINKKSKSRGIAA